MGDNEGKNGICEYNINLAFIILRTKYLSNSNGLHFTELDCKSFTLAGTMCCKEQTLD